MRFKVLNTGYYVFFIMLMLNSLLFAQEEEGVKLHFDPDRGFYKENFDLTLSTTPPNLKIKYTKDGTDPSTSVTAIEGKSPITIHVDPSNTDGRDKAPGFHVRAVAFQADTIATVVKTHTYIFTNRVVELSPDGQRPGTGWLLENFNSRRGQCISYGMDPEVCNNSLYRDKIVDALLDIPSFSMVMDLKDLFDSQQGIYVNALEHGAEWERPCSIELIYPDGTDGFQINCGVRIRGGWSRNDSNPKRAFRWFFRKEYGDAKLRYPLFGDEGVDEFDKVDLRTAMNYSWSYGAEDASKNTFLRDIWSRDLQRDMGQPYTRSRYYHLYINGTYWGLYQTQERAEASFASYYLGGDREDYDVIKVDGGYQGRFVIEATDGTMDAWQRLWEASMEGFETAAAYYKVQGLNPDGTRNPDYEVLLDVDNLIDFMITVFISGDGDAPASGFTNGPNNFYSVYNPNMERGFVHMRHDAEHTLGAQPWAEDRTGPFYIGGTLEKSNPQWIHERLCENPLYVDRFANHVYKHFFNNGAVTPEANLNRLFARKKTIELAIIAESARWGDSKRELAFTKDNGWLPAVNYIIEDFLPNRTNVVLAQLKSKGWYPQISPPTFNSVSRLVPKGFQFKMAASRGEIYYSTDGTDPYQPVDIYTDYSNFITENASKKVTVPAGSINNSWNQSVEFDDSNWISGTGNIGYEQGQGYENRIGVDVASEMVDKQTSCYVRLPFNVDKAKFNSYNILTLNVRYDDGFVAYLNGKKIADTNAPADLSWNAAATNNHEDEGWESFDVSNYLTELLPEENLLAIHGLNVSTTSSDFIIGVELIAGISNNSGELSPNAQQYTQPLVIEKTTHVKMRAFDNVSWSALSEVVLYVLEGMDNLRISEIHYHPLDNSDDENDDGEYEFIELKNIGNETLNLSGFYFSRGISYSFSQDAVLNPNEFAVLASNDSAFFNRYGFHAFGEYAGQLDNSGETIALNTAEGDTIIKIHYNDNYPWPKSADGDGYSLVPQDTKLYQDQNIAENWIASGKIHGSPGCDEVADSVQGENGESIPEKFLLLQNYPNPFNSYTTIQFYVPNRTFVTIDIYNVLGKKVDELTSRYFEPGEHSLTWNASNMASGLYFYHLKSSVNVSLTKKLILIK